MRELTIKLISKTKYSTGITMSIRNGTHKGTSYRPGSFKLLERVSEEERKPVYGVIYTNFWWDRA